MARAGIVSTATMLASAIAPMSQNTTLGPKKAAVTPTTTLQAALPPWLNASFRPMRRAKAAAPTTPSEMAAMVGGNTPAAAPATTFAAVTGQKRGASGMARQ